MAVAALAAAPLIEKYSDPEEAVKALESAAAEARSINHKIIHSASLTEKEEYQGWLPLILILYRVWQTFLGPQVAFTMQTQIGIADALNTFGAKIDTSELKTVLGKVRKTYQPSASQKQNQSQTSTPNFWDSQIL